jgi:hypothetical protein
MSMETTSRWRTVLGATGASMLLFTFACGGATSSDLTGVAAQTPTSNQAGAPVLVSCEPHQRTLVRPVVVNGATVSQVECVAVGQPAAFAQNQNPVAAPMPVSYNTVGYQAPAAQPVNTDLGDAQVMPPSHPTTVARPASARPVQTRQVVYDEPVRRTRSVKKSAIIIGSSAGVGAGVGAAVGGKKGALIGAAIGGGGAAVWDQVTRRK